MLTACGSDSTATPEPTSIPEPTAVPTVEPTAAPQPTASPTTEPTAVPEPTAAATAEPTQPPLVLEDLRINSVTTGQEFVVRLSQVDASCLSSAMGDANFQLFQGVPLIAAAANKSAKALPAGCLEDDSLVILGVSLMSAKRAGWSEYTLGCVTNLSMTHPELLYVALGAEREVAHPAHPTPGPLDPLGRV